MPKPDDKGACTSYCEVKVYFTHGREVPWDLTPCQGTECSIKKGQTVSATKTWEINGSVGLEVSKSALMGAFNFGSSYSYSTSVSYSQEFELKETLGDNECGYWTWVPTFVTYVANKIHGNPLLTNTRSCGTLTTTSSHDTSDLGAPATCNMEERREVHNWCNTTLAKSSDKSGFGQNIFVYTNCEMTGGILWDHPKQSDVYKTPGVSSASDAPQLPTVQPPPVPAGDVDLPSLFPTIGILNPRKRTTS